MQVSNPLPIHLPSLGLVRIGDWTDAAAVFRREHVRDIGLVFAPFRPTFNTTPGVDITDFDTRGWTGWNEAGADLTGSALDKSYESGGVFQLFAKNSTSGSWGSSTRDAPRRGKQYIHRPGTRLYFHVDASSISTGIAGLILWLDALDASTNSLTVGLGGGSTSTSVRRIRPGSAVDVLGAVNIGNTQAWFRLTFDDNIVIVDASAGATRPTTEAGWTYVGTVDNLFTGSGLGSTAFRPKLNIATAAINASSALTGFSVRFNGYDDSEMGGQQWGATKLETSGYTITASISCAPNAVLSDATLRTALSAAIVDALPFDSTGWTMRAKRGGAPSGAYAAVSSLVQEATAGSGLYLDLKYTSSDGIKRGALRDLYVPLAAL